MWGCPRSSQSSTRGWAKPSGPSTGPGSTGMGRVGVGTPGTQRKGVRPPAWGAIQRSRLCSPHCPHLLFLCQISNYLTVPAHKLDSPTMSRARIGSGEAGRGGPGRGLEAGHGPQRACREDGLLTGQAVSSSYVRWSWGFTRGGPPRRVALLSSPGKECSTRGLTLRSWVPTGRPEGAALLGSLTCGGPRQAFQDGGLRREPKLFVGAGTPMGAPGLSRGAQSYLGEQSEGRRNYWPGDRIHKRPIWSDLKHTRMTALTGSLFGSHWRGQRWATHWEDPGPEASMLLALGLQTRWPMSPRPTCL